MVYDVYMIMVVVVVVVTSIVQVMAQLSQELSELRQLHATHASHAGPLQPQRTSHREDEWDSCGFNGEFMVMFSNLKVWNGILEGFIWNLNDPNGFVQLIL